MEALLLKVLLLFLFAFLFSLFVTLIGYVLELPLRKKWQKASWEGVVVAKDTYTTTGKHGDRKHYVFEVCHGQNIQKPLEGLSPSKDFKKIWESIRIGNYVIKKNGSDSIEQRTVQGEEAREATQVLIRRLLDLEEKIRSRGFIGRLFHEEEKIRSRTVDALKKIGTPDVSVLIEALSDENKTVRENANLDLRKIGTPEPIKATKEAIQKKENQTRKPPQETKRSVTSEYEGFPLPRIKLTEEEKQQLQAKIQQEQQRQQQAVKEAVRERR